MLVNLHIIVLSYQKKYSFFFPNFEYLFSKKTLTQADFQEFQFNLVIS